MEGWGAQRRHQYRNGARAADFALKPRGATALDDCGGLERGRPLKPELSTIGTSPRRRAAPTVTEMVSRSSSKGHGEDDGDD